jgi:hypothetical protein
LSPLLLRATPNNVLDVVVFYSAWSLLFSFSALHEGRRITYMLPMFFALLGFDAVWRDSGEKYWAMAAIYQLLQLGIFAATAAAFTVIYKRPLEAFEGWIHGIALLYFYVLEYAILQQHVPYWAPLVGLLSGALVFLIYLIARVALQGRERIGVGAVIVSAYCSVVVAHAVLFEMIPHEWRSWGVLITTAGVALVTLQLKAKTSAALRPVLITAGAVFCIGYLELLGRSTAGGNSLMLSAALGVYAAMLYAGYFLFRRSIGGPRAAPIMLYAAHFALMTCAYRLVGDAFALSMVWAVFAVVILVAAILFKDKVLGQSSLLIFSASGLKVLMHDLAGSGSLVRVVTLIVLAVCLYVGGWLYQSLVRQIADLASDQPIKHQA